jgi:hypothetical protein
MSIVLRIRNPYSLYKRAVGTALRSFAVWPV